MDAEKREQVEDLAGLIWEKKAIELAFNNKIIPKNTYDFVCSDLSRRIDELKKICYTHNKVGDSYGFIENTQTT